MNFMVSCVVFKFIQFIDFFAMIILRTFALHHDSANRAKMHFFVKITLFNKKHLNVIISVLYYQDINTC